MSPLSAYTLLALALVVGTLLLVLPAPVVPLVLAATGAVLYLVWRVDRLEGRIRRLESQNGGAR